MFKRACTIALTFAMLLTMLCTFSVVSADGLMTLEYTADKTLAQPGETVKVTVNLKNYTPVSSMAIKGEYDEAVLELTDAQVSAFGTENDMNAVNTEIAGSINAAWINAENIVAPADLQLLSLTFVVKEGAVAGSTTEIALNFDQAQMETIENGKMVELAANKYEDETTPVVITIECAHEYADYVYDENADGTHTHSSVGPCLNECGTSAVNEACTIETADLTGELKGTKEYCTLCNYEKENLANGWYLEGTKWALYENGAKVRNRWAMDSKGWCYLGDDGYCVTNTWKKDSHGWCYLDENGRMATNKWIADTKGWCYVGADGYCLTNTWKQDSKGWVYLGADGRMVTNAWVKDTKGWCYVGEDGYCVTNCWKLDSNGWCYLGADGRMVTNQWIADTKGWCYVGEDGYCLTNTWMKDSKGWVYLGNDGRMVTNAWVMDSQGWCYVDENGYCLTNQWKADTKGYTYLDANGRMVVGQWLQVDGNWYYMNEKGYRVTGTVEIDGKTYTFNYAGVLQ